MGFVTVYLVVVWLTRYLRLQTSPKLSWTPGRSYIHLPNHIHKRNEGVFARDGPAEEEDLAF